MHINLIQAGRTHTGSMLGYCPCCSLYHGSIEARIACASLNAATDEALQLQAWRALKTAVEAEGPLAEQLRTVSAPHDRRVA